MKKIIKATQMEELPHYFENVEEQARWAGYNTSVDSDLNIQFTAMKDKEFMPKISTKQYHDRGKTWYDCILTFPQLNTENMNYHDDIHYYINEWLKVSKLTSWLWQNPYDPSVRYADEEYEDE